MTSVNTNAAATTALRTLQATNNSLEMTQSRISTGLKIGEAKDNAAYWSISTTLKSDNKSLATVKDALGLGAATVDTAYQGLNKAKDVLDDIKSKLTAATQDGVDRSKIQSEISELQKQLKSIADSSVFSGENWLSVDSSVVGYNASKNVVSSFSRDAKGSVAIGTIGVNISTVSLFDSSAAATGIVDTAAVLKKADGTVLTVGGDNASGAAPALQGLGSVTSTDGTAIAAATAAKASLGTLNLVGIDKTDRISFSIAVDGAAAAPVTFKPTGVTTAVNFASGLQTAIDTAIGAGKVTVAVNGVTNAITFESASTGSASSVAVTGLTAIDGDGVTTGVLGTAIAASPAIGDATAASITNAATNTYSAISAGQSVSFKFQYGSHTYQATLNNTNAGSVAGASTYLTALQNALDNAVDLNGGAALGTGKLTVTNPSGDDFAITTVAKGADQAVGIFDVQSSGTSAATFVTNANLVTIATASGTSAPAAYTFNAAINTAGVTAGDRVAIDVTFTDAPGAGGTHTATVNISTAGVTSANAAGDKNQFVANAQAALDVAFGAGKVLATKDGSDKLVFTTVGSGSNYTLTAANVRAIDGNGVTTTTLGLANGSAVGNAATSLAAAFVTSGSAFAGPVTFDAQDELSFNVAVDGGTATKITVNKATIDAALGGTAGTIATAANFVTVVNKALQNVNLNTALTASVDGSNRLVLTKATAGVGSVAVSGAASTTGGDSMSIDRIDVTDTALTALGVDSMSRKDVLTAYISVVNDAINKVTTAASNLGSVAKRIDMQKSFVDTLMDTIDKGVGNLIDADITEESTKLQALQVKQQLGVQALSIANQSSQNILALFR